MGGENFCREFWLIKLKQERNKWLSSFFKKVKIAAYIVIAIYYLDILVQAVKIGLSA